MSTGLAPFRAGAAVVDRSDGDTLRFSGPQARWFLDQLVTNRVLELPTGSGADSLLLTHNGRITAVLRLWASGDEEVLALLAPGAAATIGPFFAGRVFATRVEVEDRTSEDALVWVLGPRAADVLTPSLARLGADPPMLPGEQELDNATVPTDTRGTRVVVGRVTRPVAGFEVLVPRDRLGELLDALVGEGGERCAASELANLSVVEGLPRHGVDFDERFLPQEAALERAVHFAKGCYLGQEAVAMAQRGRVKRRLRHLAFEGPAVRGQLLHDGARAGEVTSIADEEGRGWGIATVATSVAPGTAVDVVPGGGSAGVRAEVRELPGTSEGPKAPSARELRERLSAARAGEEGPR